MEYALDAARDRGAALVIEYPSSDTSPVSISYALRRLASTANTSATDVHPLVCGTRQWFRSTSATHPAHFRSSSSLPSRQRSPRWMPPRPNLLRTASNVLSSRSSLAGVLRCQHRAYPAAQHPLVPVLKYPRRSGEPVCRPTPLPRKAPNAYRTLRDYSPQKVQASGTGHAFQNLENGL